MILSDTDINQSLRMESTDGLILIPPPVPNQVQPCSVDLHLGNRFVVCTMPTWLDRTIGRVFPSFRAIDPTKDVPDRLYRNVNLGADEVFYLRPGQFILARTNEFVGVPSNMAAKFDGKSSLGRLALIVHMTAGFIDAGFKGTVTLEIETRWRTIALRPGMKIGQLSFHRLSSPAERPYGHPGLGSKYQGQTNPEPSRMHRG